jgi:hypothetical protein
MSPTLLQKQGLEQGVEEMPDTPARPWIADQSR